MHTNTLFRIGLVNIYCSLAMGIVACTVNMHKRSWPDITQIPLEQLLYTQVIPDPDNHSKFFRFNQNCQLKRSDLC